MLLKQPLKAIEFAVRSGKNEIGGRIPFFETQCRRGDKQKKKQNQSTPRAQPLTCLQSEASSQTHPAFLPHFLHSRQPRDHNERPSKVGSK